jgi:DUF2934 family protein
VVARLWRICAADFAATMKPLTESKKNEALGRHGVGPDWSDGECSITWCRVELGGRDDLENLWPLGAGLHAVREALPHEGNNMRQDTHAARRPRRKVEAQLSSFPRHDEIAKRAYELWVTRGMGAGLDCDDWLRAERELLDRPARMAMAPPRRPP